MKNLFLIALLVLAVTLPLVGCKEKTQAPPSGPQGGSRPISEQESRQLQQQAEQLRQEGSEALQEGMREAQRAAEEMEDRTRDAIRR